MPVASASYAEDQNRIGRSDAGRHPRWFRGRERASGPAQVYDMVLVAVGRSPNGKAIEAEKAGVAVSDRGFIPVDKQMRTNMPHVFAIGDIVGQPMLAHKAVHEAPCGRGIGGWQEQYILRRAKFRQSPIPILRSLGPGSPKSNARGSV